MKNYEIVNNKIDNAVEHADPQIVAENAVNFIKDLVEVVNEMGDIDANFLNKSAIEHFAKSL